MSGARTLGFRAGLVGLLASVSVVAQGVAPGAALPTGGTVVAGQVTTARTGNTLTLEQTSPTAIVNWQNFSIGLGNTVKVLQPTSNSALLDRVTGNTSSVIAGQLDANGEVFLINPNGIVITPSGVIDVGGGFVASSLGISDQDFKTGKFSFTGNGASAGVSNQGVISVGRGGYAALLGGTVSNSGWISVPLGKVGLGSGEAATLDVSGDGFLQVAVPMSVGGASALIQSSGTITALGGTVVMSAATARTAARNAINLSGIVQANSISGHDGSITLSGGPGGAVTVSGTLDVSAAAGGAAGSSGTVDGGTIAVTGQNLVLQGATLAASGANGGTIEIGGDEHGLGRLLQADTLSVDANTRITANGLGTETGAGNGGSVVLWSTGQTDFLGMISATGGSEGGNGGNAEVSSENLLNYAGATNLSAPHGAFGTLLLDPYNITISSGTTTNGSLSSGSNETFTPSGSNSILSVSDLQNALGSANVTLATGGSGSAGSDTGIITVASPVSWTSGSTLTLNAYNSIIINAGISLAAGGLSLTTTTGPLTVNAPISVSGAGTVTISVPTETFTAGTASASTPNFSFGTAGNLQFTGSSGGIAEGSLTINSHAYTLLNSLAQVDGIDSTAAGSGNGYTDQHLGSGLSGYYALATDVTAPTGVSYTSALVGSSSSAFTGVFEGLGNTISGLSITSSSGGYVGLFAFLNTTSATVRDLGLIGGTFTNNSSSPPTGSLVAYNQNGVVLQDYATSTVYAPYYNSVGGLIGASSGFVVNSYATGAVTGDGTTGGLVGHNSLNTSGQINGEILNSYATGNVTSVTNAAGYVGGLVGGNEMPIIASYSTGAVYAPGNSYVGGLVGYENYDTGTHVSASISNSYATGAVYGGTDVGGLVGFNNTGATITDAYSTGAVAGTSTVGGFLGANSGSVTNGYWDNVNSGISSTGIASGTNSGVTGVSTTNLQSSANPSGVTLGAAFGGGAMAANGGTTGVYPYLIALDPNGVQAISGYAYRNASGTALASGSAGAGQVSVLIGSMAEGTVSTGATGYYYLAVPTGTISGSGSSVLAYTLTNNNTHAANAATLASETGTTSNFNVYGSELRYTTADITYSSTTSDLSTAETAASGAASALTSSFFSGLAPYITATGATFTLDQTLSPSTSFSIQTTTTNAPITVAAPFTLSGSNTVTLNAAGALAIDAPISVTGAGSVVLNYNTASPTNLSFALGDSINYGATNNGGTLSINGQAYTLLYKLTDSGNATGNGPDSGTDDLAGIDHAGDSGNYALATPLTGSGSSSAAQFSHPLAGSGSNSFSGVFEGLGNTITNLTINDSADEVVGLFGTIGHGTVRDLGLIGGSVTGTNENGGNPYSASGAEVGALAGLNGNGSGGATSWVVNDYASTAVSTPVGGIGGGLVGINNGLNANATLINSFATGAVTAGGGQSDVGGLAGYNLGISGTALITQSYATGPVYSAGDSSNVGGLFGINNANGGTATVTDSYATGAVSVSSSSRPGGIVGYGGGTTANLYWDTSTSGQSNAAGAAGANATGYTTSQLQSTSTSGITLTGFSGGAAGGQNGVYPYLTSFFPNGIQAISGYAYTNGNGTVLASGTAGPGLVSIASGGTILGTSTTGANGYYYLVLPAGTLPANQGLVGYTQADPSTGAQNGVTFAQSAGGGVAAAFDIYGGWQVDRATTLTSLSTLDSAYTTAVGSTAPANFTLPNFKILTASSFDIDQSINVSGTLQISAGGTVNESSGATLTASNLLLTGTAADYVLTDDNEIGGLASSVNSLSFFNGSALATATLQGPAGVITSGITATGDVSLLVNGSITLTSGAPVTGASPVIAATGAFINDAGAGAVTATSGRWLIYSSSPAGDTFGGLNSGNTAIFDATGTGLPPGSVTQTGNRYLFANQPVLTVTSTSDTKVYGVDDSASLAADYSVTGFPSGGGAFVTDTISTAISGAPSVTSTGSTAFSPVSGSPYPITVAPGTLTSNSGYALSYVSSGSLTVTPATITVTGASGVNKVYDTTTALPSGATGYSLSGIYSNDAGNVAVSASNAAYASANAGPENINVSGLSLTGSAAGNYQLSSTTATGSGTISPATITVSGSTGVNKVYDTTTALPSGATGYSLSGIYSNDAGNVTVSASTAAYASPNAGPENINVAGLSLTGSAAGNYQLSSTTATGSGTISPATISVTGATGVDKPYDGTTALPAGATGFSFSGVYASDSSRVSVGAGAASYASASVGPENINVSGLSLSGMAAGNYVLNTSNVTGSGTITPSSSGGSGSTGGSGSGGSNAGGTSGPITLSPLSAGGSSSYVLSGTATSNNPGATTTVVGSLSNGVVTLAGTFIVYPRSSSAGGSLPDEIAANSSEIITFVPGTLTAQWLDNPATPLASTAATIAFDLNREPFDIMPLALPTFDDPTRPWDAIDTFGSPAFDQALVCLAGQCALVPRAARRGFSPSLLVR